MQALQGDAAEAEALVGPGRQLAADGIHRGLGDQPVFQGAVRNRHHTLLVDMQQPRKAGMLQKHPVVIVHHGVFFKIRQPDLRRPVQRVPGADAQHHGHIRQVGHFQVLLPTQLGRPLHILRAAQHDCQVHLGEHQLFQGRVDLIREECHFQVFVPFAFLAQLGEGIAHGVVGNALHAQTAAGGRRAHAAHLLMAVHDLGRLPQRLHALLRWLHTPAGADKNRIPKLLLQCADDAAEVGLSDKEIGRRGRDGARTVNGQGVLQLLNGHDSSSGDDGPPCSERAFSGPFPQMRLFSASHFTKTSSGNQVAHPLTQRLQT